MRQYADIQARKRSGVALQQVTTTGNKNGQLALSCPTCPRPGFNLSNDWQQDERKFVCCLYE